MIRRPALILALLTGLNFLNYLDRLILGAVLVRVQDELHLDGTAAGALAPAFLVGYGVASPLFGLLGDRGFKRTSLLTFGVVVWSLATLASGYAWDFWSLLACRAVVGVGEASYASIAPALIDDLAPQNQKSRWLAIFYAATPVGSALGFLAGGILQERYGWRGAFQLVGGPGILLALLCLLIADAPQRHERPHGTFAPLLRNRVYLRVVGGYCLQTFALGGFAYWGPTAVHRMFGTKLETVDIVFGGLLVIAGFLGTGIGGFLGDRAATRARQRGEGQAGEVAAHVRICMLSSVIGAPFALAAVLSPDVRVFFACIFLAELGIFLSTASINAATLQSVPPALRTSAMGLSIFAIHALGDFWSPPFLGALSKSVDWHMALLPLPIALALSIPVWRVRAQTVLQPTPERG